MTVSIYIPCFNAEKTIGRCLDAVLKQTYPVKEVLVIDDGSVDKTFNIASSYPVKVIKNKTNKGLAFSRNIAIKNIDAEFVAALDSDCLPAPDWLENIMGRFTSSRISGVGGKLTENYASSIFDLWRSAHMKQYWDSKVSSPLFLFGSNCVFRRKTLLAVDLYNKKFRSNYEDVDICARIKKKGYKFLYESKAIVSHLKEDSINSILNSYWRWNLNYYIKKKFYSNKENFLDKIKDNIGLANRFLEEDLHSDKIQLLYLDFLLAIHHSLRDFEYFMMQNEGVVIKSSALSLWLSLLDITFFYHFDANKQNISTLVPKNNKIMQNFFAFSLLLYKLIDAKFNDEKFSKIIYKHLLVVTYGISDCHLVNTIFNLVQLHKNWQTILEKEHVGIDKLFLENLLFNFDKWVNDLIYRFKDIGMMIKISGEKTDKFS